VNGSSDYLDDRTGAMALIAVFSCSDLAGNSDGHAGFQANITLLGGKLQI
jgi:hypothetical protein